MAFVGVVIGLPEINPKQRMSFVSVMIGLPEINPNQRMLWKAWQVVCLYTTQQMW